MANVSKSSNTRNIPLLKARIGAALAGKWYRELTGATLFDYQAGTRQPDSSATFRGPSVSLGGVDITSFSYDLIFLPHLPLYRDLERANTQRSIVAMRHDVYSPLIPGIPDSGIMVGITAPTADQESKAKGGLIAITGTNADTFKAMFASSQIDVGDLLQIGGTAESNTYIINRIEVDEDTGKYGNAYVNKLDGTDATTLAPAAISAARNPGWRLDYNGEVAQFGSVSGDAAGSTKLTSTMVMTPKELVATSIPLFIKESDAGW